MKLPNLDQAQVPREKIVGYLLSFTHPDGRAKAEFFSRYGFTTGNWRDLALALLTHAKEHEVTRAEASPFGTRYVVEGIIRTPDDRDPQLRAVWFVEAGESVPRLVTAYPMSRR
jgi:hypothetical protein